MTSEPRISDMIRTIVSQDDKTGRALLAGALNLYTRAMRGRVNKYWMEDDIQNLFTIVDILITTYEGQVPAELDEPQAAEPADLPKVIREMAGSPRRP
jgi:hypothetical protein